ncbi:hypothetical protein DITRI_Ditri11bG0014400 [Diplodiscus trichospermus]
MMEDLEIKLEEGNERSLVFSRFLTIEKFISNWVLNRKGVLTILREIWSLELAPCNYEVRVDKFEISFKSEEIMRRATEEGPCSIMGSCCILKKWNSSGELEEVDFSEVEYWTQIHNLPMVLMTSRNTKVLGSDGDGKYTKGSNKYKKLAKYCFACGRLEHLLKSYGEEVRMAVHDENQMMFGQQLRVIPLGFEVAIVMNTDFIVRGDRGSGDKVVKVFDVEIRGGSRF